MSAWRDLRNSWRNLVDPLVLKQVPIFKKGKDVLLL